MIGGRPYLCSDTILQTKVQPTDNLCHKKKHYFWLSTRLMNTRALFVPYLGGGGGIYYFGDW